MDVMPKCCMVFNVTWQDKLTNKELYGNLPPVPSKVGFRRLKLAGHCVRHPANEWTHEHGKTSCYLNS